MSDQEKREQEIMNQELSPDEMETVAGGGPCLADHRASECPSWEGITYGRPLNRPDGSMNCAATVEDGSHCETNDACYRIEVMYMGLQDCAKAWK